MIKLSNKEASALLSPVGQRLFSDSKRPFPVKDTFLLLDLIQSVEQRIKTYHIKLREIAENHGGTILPDGSIKFEIGAEEETANKEIEVLRDIELEYPGEKLKVSDDWPKLSVQEAMILKPLISKD